MGTSRIAPERRYDIDWLRNLGILLLFPFHAARVFDVWEPFYVKNSELSNGLSWFIMGTSYWFMPLLFLLAGASSWYALKKRTPSQYLTERVGKLLVPFIFGLLVIVPPQAYIASFAKPGFNSGYFEFLKGYFTDFGDLSGYFGTFTPAHLWFIIFLFVISLAALPIMTGSRKKNPGRLLGNPWILVSVFIPITLSEALPDLGGKNPFFFFFIFLAGFYITRDEKAYETIDRIKLKCLLVLIPAIAAWIVLTPMVKDKPDFSFEQIVTAFVRDFALWLTLIVLLGYGKRFLNRNGAVLQYMNQAAFPVYIIHQTALVFVGYYIVKLDAWLPLKYVLIIAATLILSVACYELVRRIPGLRWLFGIKKPVRKDPVSR